MCLYWAERGLSVPSEPLDFDAEFEDLISGFDEESPEEQVSVESKKLSVALVLAPIPSASALFSLLSLSGHFHDIVSIKPWTAVWIQVPDAGAEEDEFASLLAEEPQMPVEVDQVARAVSRLSKFGAVAVMSWLVDGDGLEPGVSGQISARRYVGGQAEDPIPAGVLLGSLPQAAEDLLLGRTFPGDYPDSINADGTKKLRRPFGWFGR